MEDLINKNADTNFNRRKFFKTGLTWAGGSLIVSATGVQKVLGKDGEGMSSKKNVQNTSNSALSGRRKLGGSLEFSSIGFGVQNMSRTYQTTIPLRSEMHNKWR